MARKKGSNCISEAWAKVINGMSCVGARRLEIGAYYSMPRIAFSSATRRSGNASTVLKKKMGRTANLNER